MLFSLMCFNVTNEVVTSTEAADTVELPETAADEVRDFSTMNRKAKQANKYGEQLLYSWRFSRFSAPIHWLVHGLIASNNETVYR